MAQLENKPGVRSLPTTESTLGQPKRLSRWQTNLLLLILLAFLAASYAFLQPNRQAVSFPPVLYLHEDESGLLQLHMATPPDWQSEKLTTQTETILDYAPGPTGSQVAFATMSSDRSSQINLLELNDLTWNSSTVILNCENAECSQLVWHPDGRRLLYERREPPNFSRPQLWWLDIVSGETISLLEDDTAVGSNARFSTDGNWVSFAGSPEEGLRLYNFADGRSLTYPSNVGTPAAWHPVKNQLIFQNSRTIVFHGENNDAHDEHGHDFSTAVNLYLATVDGGAETHLLSSDGAFNDGNAAWSPDGEWIAFGRRLVRTNTGRQLWLMRADGSESRPLTQNIDVHIGPPSWSPDGRFLLFQQFDTESRAEVPSVWLLEISSGEFHHIATQGMLPVWLTEIDH